MKINNKICSLVSRRPAVPTARRDPNPLLAARELRPLVRPLLSEGLRGGLGGVAGQPGTVLALAPESPLPAPGAPCFAAPRPSSAYRRQRSGAPSPPPLGPILLTPPRLRGFWPRRGGPTGYKRRARRSCPRSGGAARGR